MKAYYEYEDGTFWAIHTEGSDCFVVQDSKYNDGDWRLSGKISFESPEALKTRELCLMAAKKDKGRWIMRYVPEHIRTSDFYTEYLKEDDWTTLL